MPPHRELNPRFQAHITRARRIRTIGTGVLVTCLLVGTGSALAMLAPQESAAQSTIKNTFASVADSFSSVGSVFSNAAASVSSNLFTSRNQVAAVSSGDSTATRIYRFFCPWFTDCEEPAVEFTSTNTIPTTPAQPRPQPQQPIVVATTTPQNTSTQRAGSTGTGTSQPIQQTVVNNPVIERVIERVVQGAPASLAGYVTQSELLSQIAAIKNNVGTQLYGDWYNNPGSSSNNGGIVGVIGQMGRIDSLSGTELSNITVDGVSGLTDADIPDGITASNYLLLTGGVITGDLSLSGTLTAGSLAVSGVSSGGAVEAPYFTATSTSASSTFRNLNATNATTTNATSTNMFATLGRFTSAIADAFSAVSATITNLTSTTLVATNATTTRLDAFDYVAVGRTATTTIRGDGVASTIPYASSTAISVSGTGYFGTASTTNFNLSGTANLQSIATDSLLYNNSSRQLAAATIGSSLSFTGSSLSLNLGNGNTWTGLQQFYGAASSTLFSANWAKFGATASSTFGTDGSLTMGGNIILNGKYLSGDGSDEGVYVDTSGNVGIGTANPAEALDVNGNVRVRGTALYMQGASAIFGTNLATNLSLQTDATTRVTISSTGNVGIGTTSPFALLSVAGNGFFNGNLTSANLMATGTLSVTGLSTLVNASTTQLSVSNTAYFPGSGIWNSSGNVGIGTTTPTSKLDIIKDVSDGSVPQLALRGATDPRLMLRLGYNTTGSYGFVDAAQTGVAAKNLVLNESGGNVGIGTTSPQYPLHVYGSTSGGGVITVASVNAASNGSAQFLTNNASSTAGIHVASYDNGVTSTLFGQTIGGSNYIWSGAGTILGLGTTNSQPLFLGTNNIERVRIDTSGNVGVGTTTPQATLEILGRGRFASSTQALPTYGAGIEIQYRDLAPENQGVILAYDRTASAYKNLRIDGSSLLLNSASAGNVGIGTTTPNTLLNVYGDLWDSTSNNGVLFTSTDSVGAALTLEAQAGSGRKWSVFSGGSGSVLGAGKFGVYDNAGGAFRLAIDTSGNVGIGTTTPTSKLHVYDTSGSPPITSFTGSSAVAGLRVQRFSGVYYTDLTHTTNANSSVEGFSINVGNGSTVSEIARFNANGNVGIGTTTPSSNLSVVRSGSGAALTVQNTNSAAYNDIQIRNNLDSAVRTLSLGYTGSGFTGPYWTSGNTGEVGAVGTTGAFPLTFGTNNTQRMVIDSSGNVGIGTTSPLTSLSIANSFSSATGGAINIGAYDSNYNGIWLNGGTGTLGTANFYSSPTASSQSLFINRPTGGDISFSENNGTAQMILKTSTGNLGIGTTNPNDAKVEVKGGTVCVDTNSDDSATSCIASESDERLKTNITSISASSSLDIITALNPVSFDWRATDPEVLAHWPSLGRYAGNTHSIGLIAQQVMPVLPEALSLETVGDSEVQYFQLDYTKFVPHLIGAVKELWAKVQDLGQKVAALFESVEEQNAKIQALEARVNQLEAQTGAAAASSSPPPPLESVPPLTGQAPEPSQESQSDEPAAEVEPPSENSESEPVAEIEESEVPAEETPPAEPQIEPETTPEPTPEPASEPTPETPVVE